jgi:pimeloyl-ACP methyl ester carboxylesterase
MDGGYNFSEVPVRTALFSCLAALMLSGCGMDGPPPQEARESAKPTASPASKPEIADTDRKAARPPSPIPANGAPTATNDGRPTLSEARIGFTTKLIKHESDGTPVPTPPAGVLQVIQYESPAGRLKAYLSPAPTDGQRHPGIIWIHGGDCNGISASRWTDGPPDNDQSAGAFRKSSIVVMFPSLRGGNDNPGHKEGMFGEIDDIVAAAAFLAKQDYVDPKRIYLGGHSTGGTMVLLAAECSDRFRAVFSFGPAASIGNYGGEFAFHDLSDKNETLLRTPAAWLSSIHSPTFVIEGTGRGNLKALQVMARICKNPIVRFLPVNGATHFDVLLPASKLIVEQIIRDTGENCAIELTEESLNKAFAGASEPSPRSTSSEKGPPRLIVDKVENTAAGIGWNKDIVLDRPTTVGFNVTSQGRFAVTILTDKAYQALQRSDEKALAKQDILFMRESEGLEMNSKVALPAGTWWFFIENRSDTPVDFHLKCFALSELGWRSCSRLLVYLRPFRLAQQLLQVPFP